MSGPSRSRLGSEAPSGSRPRKPAVLIGYALIVGAATGWGTWPLILRLAPMPAALQAAVLVLVVSFASLPVMLVDRIRVRATRADWLRVAWIGLADAMNVVLFFAAYQRTTVAIAVLTHCMTPIFVALAAPFTLGERLRRSTIAAVVVSFAGLLLLLEPWRAELGAGDLVGALLGGASALFYASNVVVQKRVSHVFSASEVMFYHGFVAGPILCALVPAGAFAETSWRSLGFLVCAGIFPGLGGALAFLGGLRRVDASHASILTLMEPLVAVVLAASILGQRPGFVPLLGAGMILSGAIVVVRSPR